jgi:hypothetical protein
LRADRKSGRARNKQIDHDQRQLQQRADLLCLDWGRLHRHHGVNMHRDQERSESRAVHGPGIQSAGQGVPAQITVTWH